MEESKTTRSAEIAQQQIRLTSELALTSTQLLAQPSAQREVGSSYIASHADPEMSILSPSVDTTSMRGRISFLRSRVDAATFQLRQHELRSAEVQQEVRRRATEHLKVERQLVEANKANALLQGLLDWEKQLGLQGVQQGQYEDAALVVERQQQLRTLRGQAVQQAYAERDTLQV
jgi:hypothetical protein